MENRPVRNSPMPTPLRSGYYVNRTGGRFLHDISNARCSCEPLFLIMKLNSVPFNLFSQNSWHLLAFAPRQQQSWFTGSKFLSLFARCLHQLLLFTFTHLAVTIIYALAYIVTIQLIYGIVNMLLLESEVFIFILRASIYKPILLENNKPCKDIIAVVVVV